MNKLLTFFFSLLACVVSFGMGSGIAVAENITIELFSWRPAEKRVWAAVNESQYLPGITVNARATVLEYYADLTLLNIQNKKADVFLWQPGAARLKPLIDKGYIAPYTKDLSMMNAGALQGGLGPDGQYYGVPFAVQLQALMVNNLEAKKLGVSAVPKTLAQLEAAFDKILKAGKIPLSLPLKDDWYISQLIGEVFTAGLVDEHVARDIAQGTACFNQKEYTEIFRVLDRWSQRGYLSSDAMSMGYYNTYQSVAFGNAITSLEGAWLTGRQEVYYVVNPDYEFEFWTIAGGSAKYSAFGDGTYQVAMNSPKLAAAKKVLEFTTTKEFSQIFVKYAQQLPAYAGELDIPEGNLKSMSALIASSAYPVSLFNTYELNKQEPTYKSLFIEAVRNVYKKDMSPSEAGTFIQRGLNSWGYIGAKNCNI